MVTFRTEKISQRITRIYGICTELMYLVEGDHTAVLIDTGSGIGSLKQTVQSLTKKPLLVLLTHGHADHAMGAAEFDHVYMNHEDIELFRRHGREDFRWEGICMFGGNSKVEKSDFIPTADVSSFHDLSDGQIFDIGGEVVEVYALSGHTKGSVAVLIRNEGVLLTGDACNGNTFLFESESLSVQEYHENLLSLKERLAGKYHTVVSSHDKGILPEGILDEVIDVCKDIENGRADDIPFEFRGGHGWKAKQTRKGSSERLDGKTGNIIYSKSNVRKAVFNGNHT